MSADAAALGLTVARRRRISGRIALALLPVLGLAGLVVIALATGRFSVPVGDVFGILAAKLFGWSSQADPVMRTVVLQVRLPRVVAALVVGAALAAAGATYQGLFRNPLVSPDILGVSAGASLGAVLGIFLSLPVAAIQGLAFVGGLGAVGAVYAVGATVRRHDPVLTLVLAGVAVGALLGAAISLLKVLADPYNQLPAITYWLLGSLASVTLSDVGAILPAMVLGLVPLVLLRWRMNLMSLGEEEARALGIETRLLRPVLIAAATLVTAAAVSVTGVIGWIGLLVPHVARLLVGPDFRRLLPASLTLGAGYLLAVDLVARTVAPVEVPLGILTALIGAPFFLWLLASGRRGVGMMLTVEDLAFGYGARRVGAGVSLTVRAGEVLALLGPNGGGKTTLFKTLLGLLPALGGRMLFDGEDMSGWSRKTLARSLGYVPQAQGTFFPFRVRDMVLMGRASRLGTFASPGRSDHAIADRVLDTLEIAHLAERPYTEISGGERQMVLIARALAGEPRLLVMDEPTASLDFGNQTRVLSQVRRLSAGGIAVILSTHDPDHAFLCADRVALLHEGRIMALGPPAATVTAESLERLYGVAVAVVPLPGHRHSVCAPLLS